MYAIATHFQDWLTLRAERHVVKARLGILTKTYLFSNKISEYTKVKWIQIAPALSPAGQMSSRHLCKIVRYFVLQYNQSSTLKSTSITLQNL